MNFDYIQMQKQMLQTVRLEKKDEKSGVICLDSTFPSSVMILKMPRKMHCFATLHWPQHEA